MPQSKKAGSAVKKPWHLKIVYSKWDLWAKKSLHVTMVSCLLCFIFNGNANYVTALYHAWTFGDRLFTFNCCQKILALIIIKRQFLSFVAKNEVVQMLPDRRARLRKRN